MAMKPAIIALDIGATKTVIGRVVEDRVQAERHLVTSALFRRGGNIAPLVSEIRKLWKLHVKGIAIGFAGVVSDGAVLAAPNFSSDLIPPHFALSRLLTDIFDVSVSVMNDTECFTFGEAVFGAGRHKRCVVGLTLGTGVGGGIVIDGVPYRGTHALAGEFGHLPFPSEKIKCGCGQLGHLENILSGPGLARLYALATGREGTSEEVVKAARRGDVSALEALRAIEEALVHLILTVLLAWDPDVIVVGGGIAKIPRLLVTARRLVRQRVAFPPLRRVPIVPSLLHDHAVILGAAHLASFKKETPRYHRLFSFKRR
ncbi:hypothetical protein A2752_03555 [Candidatus Uhrbacteria bacterium RIFCSPHIGHO2_01_FULL_46_23]|nr:MAG: hypothetical protein A2752_03555 [Candidatus Uhrbacteria bacterium RIFCSPHIGHO2_01_FULL_46_23]OGL86663.1 MAG: hypothetical protein A3I37_05070 [Candidatus Uhrbacteria bacterium RIFCSPLOWO2_02_FULL_46_19]